MTLQEAILSEKPFKRKDWEFYFKVRRNSIYLESTNSLFIPKKEDILANDYEIEEKWYEGNFKKKWPNGVLCKVGDNIKYHQIFAIVVDYIPDSQNPFLTINNTLWKSAEPIKPEEAPAIIKI